MSRLLITAICILSFAPTVGLTENLNMTRPAHRAPQPDPTAEQCLATNIFFEARNQGIDGMFAVANLTINRVNSNSFPDTICGVVHQGPRDGSPITLNRCQFSWFCDGKSDLPASSGNIVEIQAWEWAQATANSVLHSEVVDTTNGGLYYHADYVTPYWVSSYTLTATIGSHLFYSE